ncbi:MAG TPA: ABC transporter permease [Bryobacteraceae bacterium]|jgi:hypothetical protein|nr:ABC transporter permease [Bryobacteraceae bacterium]
MKHHVMGLILVAALLGACSHAEFRKMMHGEPERRVRVATESSSATYEKMSKLDDTFDTVAASRPCDSGNVRCAGVSADWFRASRLQPLLGRAFVRDEEASSNVAIVSAGFWERRYGKDPALIGRVIEIGEKKYTVVGVVAKEAGRSADVYVPWSPTGDSMSIIALLRPGVDLKKAQVAVDAAGLKVTLERPPAE